MMGREDSTTMKRRRHTPEQIIRKLAEGEKLLGEGKPIEEVVRHLEVTESTWHRWRNQYGGMKADDAKELRGLRHENQRLKKIVADQALDIEMLRELNRKKW
jgi:putative transposase